MFLVIISFSILLAAFFSAAETAITGASTTHMHQLRNNGNKRAALVLKMRADKERLISAVLLGNNAANVISSSVATAIGIELFGSEGMVYAAFLMTAIILVFAEVLPKAYAFEHADKTSLFVAPILNILMTVLMPITSCIEKFVVFILKLFPKTSAEDIPSSEVLKGIIDWHHTEGRVIKEEKDRLGGVLDLHKIDVSQIMVHRTDMLMLDVAMPVSEIIKKAAASPHSRIPIWEGNSDNIIGILYIRDLLPLIAAGQDINIRATIKPAWFVPDTTSVNAQLNAFRKRHQHFAFVIDEYGTLQGMLTLEDILEEIVGQIEDEHDVRKTAAITKFADDTYIIKGYTSIRDINRELDWDLPDEDANTIAGYILFVSQKVPRESEVIETKDFVFEILEKEHNRIIAVKATKKLDSDDEQS